LLAKGDGYGRCARVNGVTRSKVPLLFPTMLADVDTELVKLIPAVLWVFVAVWALILFKGDIRKLLGRAKGVKALGIELSLAQEELDRAAQEAAAPADEAVEKAEQDLERADELISFRLSPDEVRAEYIARPEQRSKALRRAQTIVPALEPGAQVLWVDDHPENNRNERRVLQSLGIFVDEVRSTEEALASLRRASYDLVLSDMARDGDAEAGLRMLSAMRTGGIDVEVIFYVGLINPLAGVPPGAFGITARPDELVHYVLDVLERRRL